MSMPEKVDPSETARAASEPAEPGAEEERLPDQRSRAQERDRDLDPYPTFRLNRHESSALYFRDPETGAWQVRNPAAAVAYNCLYREDRD
jgi:hypothetical protein